jgi:hypothetical protein
MIQVIFHYHKVIMENIIKIIDLKNFFYNKMNTTLKEICNNNEKNMPSQELYDSFNQFIFDKDIKVLGKLLHRFKYFELTKHLAGDIVELGVFKGSGMSTFIKFLEIFCTHSNKKVIGFDLFDADNTVIDHFKSGDTMKTVYGKTDNNLLSLTEVNKNLSICNPDQSKFILIKGDVCLTTKQFADENPGFRIGLLYIDLDLDEPVYESLKNLWDKILPGGYIIFDEYEYHKFDESNGVDRFLKELDIHYEVKSTNWMAPSAYLIKKNI